MILLVCGILERIELQDEWPKEKPMNDSELLNWLQDQIVNTIKPVSRADSRTPGRTEPHPTHYSAKHRLKLAHSTHMTPYVSNCSNTNKSNVFMVLLSASSRNL